MQDQIVNTMHLDPNISSIGHINRYKTLQSGLISQYAANKGYMLVVMYPDPYDIDSHDISIDQDINTSIKLEFHQIVEMHRAIDSLSTVKENWDGEGSKKPTDKTLSTAKDFAKQFYNKINSSIYGWIDPRIYNEQNGYVSIEWQNQDRQLYFDIKDNSLEYTKMWKTVDKKGDIWRDSETDFVYTDNYIHLWEWLING